MALLKKKEIEKGAIEIKGNILTNWSVGKKIIGGFLLVSVMPTVAGVTGILNIGTIGRATDRISYEESPLADASMEMIISLITGREPVRWISLG